jgi:Zinc finger, ZZ type
MALHHDVYCNDCDLEIRGIRYKCSSCPEYDLCSKCEVKSRHFNNHIALKIVRPLSHYGYHIPIPDMYMSGFKQVEDKGYLCPTCRVNIDPPVRDFHCRCCECILNEKDSFCSSCSYQLRLCCQCGCAITKGYYFVKVLLDKLAQLNDEIEAKYRDVNYHGSNEEAFDLKRQREIKEYKTWLCNMDGIELLKHCQLK